jgi:hypothetical protein
MGIAAGGKIVQTVCPDPNPDADWLTQRTTTFNVHILNSTAFKEVTNLSPPPTPISAKDYADAKLPFYKIWGEEATGIHGDFGVIKTVNELDKEDDERPAKKRHVEAVKRRYTSPLLCSTQMDLFVRFAPSSSL